MEISINRKIFLVLLIASLVASVMVMPYALSLSPKLSEVFSPVLLIAQMAQALILFSIVIFFGLRLARHSGFGVPIIEGYLKGENVGGYLKQMLGLSVGMGVLAGVLIILLSFLFPSLSIEFLKAEVAVPAWKGFLASFYGGITEEILCRLFLVNLIIWISMMIKKTADGKPTQVGIWVAIVLAAVLFGLGHLPITGTLTAITLAVIARAILLNGVPGIIFGWLYKKKGLESAMLAHFSTDIIIHVAVPTIAAFFV